MKQGGIILRARDSTVTTPWGSAELGPLRFRILHVLAFCKGRMMVKDIARRAYQDREDGGPDWGLHSVSTVISRMRRPMASIGIRIVNQGSLWHIETEWGTE